MSEFKLIFRDWDTHKKLAEINDPVAITYTLHWNTPGILEFALGHDHHATDLLSDKTIVEVHRRNSHMGLDWKRDFAGLVRYRKLTARPEHETVVRCPELLSILAWRHVMYPPALGQRSFWDQFSAETILKHLVYYNLGAGATTANDRYRMGVLSQVQVTASAFRGTYLIVRCAFANVMDVVTRVAIAGGVTVGLAPDSGNLVFDVSAPRDLRNRIYFSEGRGNMTDFEFVDDRLKEATVALVRGPDVLDEPHIVAVPGVGYELAVNDFETFTQNESEEDDDMLVLYGLRHLEDYQRQYAMSFRALQVPATYFGVHYEIGDKVSAQYGDVEFPMRITGATVTFSQKGEEIDVMVENA